MNHNPFFIPYPEQLKVEFTLDSHEIKKLDNERHVYKEYFTSNAHYMIEVTQVNDTEEFE